ncbi:putative dienelactone hydrolase [Paraburkholderia sp. GAS448]|uniref:alpha/beta hydrolase family protein n=1 Tax=Paraburkholderia sp. GAS448 TaxID=3035136 RepID=UPI003D193233
MLRRCVAVVAFIAAFSTCAAAPAVAADIAPPYHVGETVRLFHPNVARNWRGAQTEGLLTTIWYPVDADLPEAPHDIGAPGAPIFRGHPYVNKAPLSPVHQKYPLLLLSHGTGGSADSLDWLASALAAQGYVVAGVNHPGNNALEPLTREGFILWWERATDVSEVLDALLADPTLGPRIDTDRVGAVGFSLGGYTVLELAGARTNFPAFENFCRSPAADAICRPPEMDRLKDKSDAPGALSPEATASVARAGASYRDARIKAVFAIAPALGEAFDNTSFTEVNIPVSLVAGAADVIAPVETNIRRIGGFLPKANVALVPGAAHDTFLDTCLPAAVDHLANLCKDNPGVDRDAVHTQSIERVLDFFARTLPSKTL